MTNNKKSQQEIERLLRRTQEEINSYDSVYTKFNNSTSPQREKLEAELRREARKLQRSYDLIKAACPPSDSKDSKGSVEPWMQKLHERIETFKMCEQAMKTKGSGKDGLGTGALSEAQQEGVKDVEAWLKNTTDSLRKQVQLSESDAERSGRGNHGRNKNSVSATTSTRTQKLKFHVARLELLLKGIANGDVNPESVYGIKERVEAIKRGDTNGSDDDDNNEDEDLYAQFGFDEQLVSERRRGGSTVGEDEDAASPNSRNPNNKLSPVRMGGTKSNTPSSSAKMSGPTSSDARKGPGSATANRMDGAKRLGSGSPSPHKGNTSITSTVGGRDGLHDNWDENADFPEDDMDKMNDDTFGDDAMAMVGTGSLADMARATSTGSRLGDWEKGRPASLVSPPSTTSKKSNLEQPAAAAPSQASGTASMSPSSANTAATGETRQLSAAPASHVSPAPASTAHDDFLDRNTMLQLIDMSLANLPHTQDVDRQRPFEPSNPTVHVPFFPQQVLPALASPEIYRTFELETLFFIFYYHQNTYQQYCAAGQIKERSFRYHTQLNTWFKRNGPPKESLEGSERGSFQFFNFEEGWNLEEKEDFVFDYKYLENELR
ncbi:hypothetical protein, conserved [Trypanosoma brucei gambiense DAL972]|uniref:NOT5 protein (NOT5) n=1 Tax=Trypanosoma brucei gambiense (strain MHOM/CI/86/DAL972) TaxID=679716 RepID=C9ZK81_TRYB9|nr:hypothetical protein, conserved [Trypanosoma brucei gambiense DAL972]CBH09845.1 hypothetical protein, conserved [Trypanosoma brucei gambiense DAL972]|eukprot:XP_011772138.1 hypothetical protein, conserved [Trypanosoma brucei gambiense DAL972]